MSPEDEALSREAQAHQIIADLLGVKDLAAFHIVGLLFHIGNLIERIGDCAAQSSQLSSARLRLLLPLLVAERMGEPGKVTPTALSHFHRVSRNTISTLLRGLEAQGLITREIDPVDRRKVRIQLTDAGRALVVEQAPNLVAQSQGVFASLTAEERDTLLRLLVKVRDAMVAKCNELGIENVERKRVTTWNHDEEPDRDNRAESAAWAADLEAAPKP